MADEGVRQRRGRGRAAAAAAEPAPLRATQPPTPARASRRRAPGDEAAAAAAPEVEPDVDASSDPDALSWTGVFAFLGAVRLAATLGYGLISDCDETFNYWEPSHYLLYGSGLQTWEYSPQYAFRSYAYAGFHSALGYVLGAAWGADKIAVFHRTRYALALGAAAAEALLVTGVAARFGKGVGWLTLAVAAGSVGLAHAAPSYLPSTWTMVWLTAAWGAWLHGADVTPEQAPAGAAVPVVPPHGGSVNTTLVVAFTVTGLLLGWPFAVVALVPFGLHLLATRRTHHLIINGALWTGAVLGVSAVVDRHYYGKWVIAAYNIILYNAFGVGGGGQGSDLYGVEPADWYARNMLLNFNVFALLAAASPLAVGAALVRRLRGGAASTEPSPATSAGYAVALLGQLWLWFGLMSSRPHKEERFLFPVFPLVPVAAAVTLYEALAALDDAAAWVHRRLFGRPAAAGKGKAPAAPAAPRSLSGPSRLLGFLVLALGSALSLSRYTALVAGYSAPFKAWTALGRRLQYGVPAWLPSPDDDVAARFEEDDDAQSARRPNASTAPLAHMLFTLFGDALGGSGSGRPLVALGGPSRSHVAGVHRAMYALPTDELMPMHLRPLPAWYTAPATPPTAGELLAARASGAAAANASLSGPLVCVGKEWYRFPASYFLPEATGGAVADPAAHPPRGPAVFSFIKSGFSGLLPQPYLPHPGPGSSVVRTGYNDENREEPDRYVPPGACDYVVDYELPVPREAQYGARYEPHFAHPLVGPRESAGPACEAACSEAAETGADATRWRSLASFPFLHAESTPALARALYISGWTDVQGVYGTYHVLSRINCRCAPSPPVAPPPTAAPELASEDSEPAAAAPPAEAEAAGSEQHSQEGHAMEL